MATLTYVGRAPDSDAVMAPKSYADAQGAAAVVDAPFVTTVINSTAALLTTKAYVDGQNALLAKQADVLAADTGYVAATKLNAASGVAGLDGSSALFSAQVPSGVLSDRIARAYATGFSSGAVGVLGGLLSSVSGAVGVPAITTSGNVSTTSIRELKLASVVIPDPGFPWRALPFGWIAGNSSSADQPSGQGVGTGNFGLLSVLPPASVSNQIYGIGICASDWLTQHYPILPYAATGTTLQTPTSVPPIIGGLELDLYGCCWSGTTYTFLAQDMAFWVLVLPAM